MSRKNSFTPDSLQHFLSLAALQIRRALLDLKKHYYGPQGMGAHHKSHDGKAVAGGDDPAEEDRSDRTLERFQFHELIESLPEAERAVVDLLVYHDLKQAEAAALLHVTVRTVQNRFNAAMVRLRQQMKQDEP